MDPSNNEQTELLRLIWNEMKALGQNLGGRIDETNARLDQTNQRIDSTNQRIDAMHRELKSEIQETNQRLGSVEMRLESLETRVGSVEETLHELAAQQLILGRFVRNASEREGRAIDELRERVVRVEMELASKR